MLLQFWRKKELKKSSARSCEQLDEAHGRASQKGNPIHSTASPNLTQTNTQFVLLYSLFHLSLTSCLSFKKPNGQHSASMKEPFRRKVKKPQRGPGWSLRNFNPTLYHVHICPVAIFATIGLSIIYSTSPQQDDRV